VVSDRLTITDAISRVAEILRARGSASFAELLAGAGGERHTRSGVIATFLALLEMARLRLVRIHQPDGDDPGAAIQVEARETLGEGTPTATEDYR
jgi:segregation and condensation protein A